MTPGLRIAFAFALVRGIAGAATAQVEPAAEVRASFLSVGIGARPAALGGAFTSVADDASALSWNPAGLALLRRPAAVATYDLMGLDTSLSCVAGALPVAGGTLGAGVIAFTYGTLVVRNELGDKVGTESPVDLCALAGYGLPWPRWFPVPGYGGASVEVVREASGIVVPGVSLGGMVQLAPALRGGWALMHLGPRSGGFSLPGFASAGIGWMPWREVQVALDGGWMIAPGSPWVAAGAEYSPHPALTVRAGYRWRPTQASVGGSPGFAAGLGVRPGAVVHRPVWSVDYAFQPFSGVAASHRVAVSYGFAEGWKAPAMAVTASRIREAVAAFIGEKSGPDGLFPVRDERSRKDWRLSLNFLRESVVRYGNIYRVCSDFAGKEGDRIVDFDIDFWVRADAEGYLDVSQVKIHSMDNVQRLKYKGDGTEVP
ncbi:MAG: UPF0164 family protein [Candidatus Coatesbacteria bacterium]